KVTFINYPEGKTEYVEAENGPDGGTRQAAFSREIYIEQEDFMEDPAPKFHRLSPGREARLKSAYIIKCEEAVKNAAGEIIELRCTYDPLSKSGKEGANRKVKGTLHWVEGKSAADITVRLYDHLLKETTGDEEESSDITATLNPDSRIVLSGCKAEPLLAAAENGSRCQFLRQGYFIKDKDSSGGIAIYNRIVGLKDSYAKAAEK
ncbi:MAG: glutamine--tRNA ligase, partial [Bacillota bacterium]|nr:glutamine--tRNA ligase [Bacillota bacterium]